MTFKRNYLTSDELIYILNRIGAATDEFSKEILKVSAAAQILIEDEDWTQYELCNDVYDKVMSEDINLYSEVKNYYVIDEILKKENSLEKVVERFLSGIESKIDEYGKQIDLESLKGLVGELKNLEGEDKVTEAE